MHTVLARMNIAGETEYVVGFSSPAGFGYFRVIRIFATEDEAIAYAAYLNGGTMPAATGHIPAGPYLFP